MSPTVLRVRGFRFYFFSREEPRAAQELVEEHIDDIRRAWAKHFPA